MNKTVVEIWQDPKSMDINIYGEKSESLKKNIKKATELKSADLDVPNQFWEYLSLHPRPKMESIPLSDLKKEYQNEGYFTHDSILYPNFYKLNQLIIENFGVELLVDWHGKFKLSKEISDSKHS